MAEHFFIVGAQRSATTWLYWMLDQHPAIELAKPVRPEPKYFLRTAPPMNADSYRRELFMNQCARWYGEKSTSYIEHPDVAERISRMFPGARILFMLRDPVHRAISNYNFSVDNGLETMSLEDALEQEPERVSRGHAGVVSVSPYAYAGRGHYVRYLDNWAKWFGREQIELLVTENMIGSEQAIRDLFGRFGIDTEVALRGTDERVNQATTVSPSRDASANAIGWLREQFRESNEQLRQRYGVDTSAWQ